MCPALCAYGASLGYFFSSSRYNKLMQFLRKAALASAASLLTLALFTFGLAWSAYQVVHTPGTLKGALDSSGIYSSAVPALLKEKAKEPTPAGSTEDIPTDRPEIQNVIKQAFPAEFLQGQTEGVIDSVYKWLDGTSPELAFSIELGEAKTRLALGLEQYALQRLNTLPACAPGVIPSGDIDAFNAECVPAGIDKAAIAAKAKQQVLEGEFLKDTTINSSTINKDGGKPLDEQLKAAPDAYQGVQAGVWGGGILAALLAAAVVFLSATRRGGARKVAITAITVGALSTLLAWLSNFGVHKFSQKAAESDGLNNALQPQLLKVAETLASSFMKWWLGYGIVLVVLGIAALIVLHKTLPKAIDLRTHSKKPAGDEAPVIGKGTEPGQSAALKHEHTLAVPKHEPPKPTDKE
jgi:hypothetical protein